MSKIHYLKYFIYDYNFIKCLYNEPNISIHRFFIYELLFYFFTKISIYFNFILKLKSSIKT